MSSTFEIAATENHARAIVALHDAVALDHRRERAGARPWKTPSVERVVGWLARSLTVVAREHVGSELLVAAFRLDAGKGFCGVARFTEVARFVYLEEMVVHPSQQRRGLGRRCLEEAERRARELGATAVRLDTNDDAVGAASFYEACGYRVVLRHAQTIYLERLLEV